MSVPAYVYFGIILAIAATGMICNTVVWALEKRRAGR